MADFTPITTQEQFETALEDRLQRERDSLSKKYGDYEDLKIKVGDYEKKIVDLSKSIDDSAKKYAGYDKTLADMTAKVKGYETNSVKMRIAHETGIPYELANRLSGDTEDDIRKDAESISKLVGKNVPYTPPRSTEPAGTAGNGGNDRAALKALSEKLKGE